MKKSTKKKNSQSKNLIKELDLLWAKIILKKFNHKCAICGKNDRLQAHHIFSRNKRSTRWDIENGICLCSGHHYQAHINHEWFRRKVIEFIGDKKYEELYYKSQTYKKYTKKDLEQILNFLKGWESGDYYKEDF